MVYDHFKRYNYGSRRPEDPFRENRIIRNGRAKDQMKPCKYYLKTLKAK